MDFAGIMSTEHLEMISARNGTSAFRRNPFSGSFEFERRMNYEQID